MTHQSAPSYSSSGGHFDVSSPNERRGGAAGPSPCGFRVFGTGSSCQRRSEYLSIKQGDVILNVIPSSTAEGFL